MGNVLLCREKAEQAALRCWGATGARPEDWECLKDALRSYRPLIAGIPPEQFDDGITEHGIGICPVDYFVYAGGLIECGLVGGGKVCNFKALRQSVQWTLITLGCDRDFPMYEVRALLAVYWKGEQADWGPALAELAQDEHHAAAGNGRMQGALAVAGA